MPELNPTFLETPSDYGHDHRRASCDELIAQSYEEDFHSGGESDNEPLDNQNLLGRRSVHFTDVDPDNADFQGLRDGSSRTSIHRHPGISETAIRRRAFFVRCLALLCACFLSVGSHYASYVLGPLKSRLSRELGASNTEFSLLFSAYSLNSTWTPLIGGLLASTMGTTFTSILATGIILGGQVLLLVGQIWGNIRMMAFGLFIFGLGVSPLAVVQETIIVRFFKSHGLGVSMAFGLIVGKGASFVSARTSYPLTEHWGSHAPFYVATFLAAMSFFVNLLYIMSSKWFVDGACAELEAADISEEAKRRSIHNLSEAQALEKVARKKMVHLKDITKLGDVFWAYVGLNVLCGMIWSPFTHLSSNIIEKRYGMAEENAANTASYLLAGSIFLYPVCGFLVDRFKHRPIVIQLMLVSSTLTLLAFCWLVLPPNATQTPIPAIASFALGHGFSPLLLVVIVPKIVSLKYVSTALGVHKSLEQTGSTIFQTLAGLALDTHAKDPTKGEPKETESAIQRLLNVFLALNVLHMLTIAGLAYLQRKKDSEEQVEAETRRQHSGHASVSISPDPSITNRTSMSLSAGVDAAEVQPLLQAPNTSSHLYGHPERNHSLSSTGSRIRQSMRNEKKMMRERKRGALFAGCCAVLILFAWVLFMGTAYARLGLGKKRH
ncbi:major facilitator superfamily domain-containing protein [Lentinula aciculospora]|uniref:Lysosomal dipeptide transporter MFSD1 n=1 Tax=Lentinula aciculospora TaxID=153920 RepID=A0A9W9AM29_9AGAR|nr:major facilitator superfamily domain-containing protein [Lentinula aciculospora]